MLIITIITKNLVFNTWGLYYQGNKNVNNNNNYYYYTYLFESDHMDPYRRIKTDRQTDEIERICVTWRKKIVLLVGAVQTQVDWSTH